MEALRSKGYDGALKEYLMLAGEGGERGGGKHRKLGQMAHGVLHTRH